jgi:hypothetical protein
MRFQNIHMRKSIFYLLPLLAVLLFGCKKENYPGGQISPYVSIFDVRDVYRGSDITLSKDNLFGSDKITGIVTSDHSAGNLPAGLMIMQDKRRLSQLRGIAVNLGPDAANFNPGDSVIIDVAGTTLTEENGILQIKGVTPAKITTVSTGNPVDPHIVKANAIVNNPEAYESVLVTIVRAGFDASYPPGTTYAGDRKINDGFGELNLHTEPAAPWAGDPIPFLSNFTGIVFNTGSIPELWPRTVNDITILSATAPKIAPIVITGYLVDPIGSDGNYEYIQLMATKDINFATHNFSIVTTNNAGSSTPTGFPVNGWATGGTRTYKIDLTTGSVVKGQYFYVGGNPNICGAGSTDISSATWFSQLYVSTPGDGFGSTTTNLLANSGNAAGISIFDLTAVTNDTIPVDVLFYGGGGSVYTAGPPERGYRITNTDYYDLKNPTTLDPQPFFNQGSNTGKLSFPPANNFVQLGGTYNTTTGRWTTARVLTAIPMTAGSTRTDIEGATTLEQ